MYIRKYIFQPTTLLKYLFKWAALAVPVAWVVGSLVALFLWLLDVVTQYRWQHEWLLYLLPLAGIAIHLLYKLWGKDAEAGNNLIIDEIHEPDAGVPPAMTPLVMMTTLITHLFGGSAGREGTAVQVGGSMAHLLGRWFRLEKEDMRVMLMMGISAGFGAVFGTPLTGAVFALEILSIRKIKYNSLIPCLLSALFANIVCIIWGIHHTQYTINYHQAKESIIPFLPIDLGLSGKIFISSIAFGIVSYLFINLSHKLKKASNKLIPVHWLIPVIGGIIIIALTYLAGTHDYSGLGVNTLSNTGYSIVNSFKNQGVTQFSWLWKIIFTAVTLGMGFKGGEVTPLFFIGAALGNTLSVYLGGPVDLFAALGFIAVFAGATNTPLACILMGVELFGTEHVLYFAIACFTAYLFSGHKSIYTSQKRPATQRKYIEN